MAVTISICENNANGNPSGYVDAIEINRGELHFEAITPQSVKFAYYDISNHRNVFWFDDDPYPAELLTTWYGNISWNAYGMEDGYFLAFINHVIRSKKFSLSYSEGDISEKINNQVPLTAEDFDWILESTKELVFNPLQLELF